MEVLSVSQLTGVIKQNLEGLFPLLSVRGEVSNLRHQSSGHLYFTLKDAEAQISAVLFRGSAARLSRLPKDGDQVTLSGQLTVYAPRGNYQIIATRIEFSGTGDLLRMLQERKEELQKRGWFDPASKKKIPKLPERIGVITSPTGSVIQDIIQVLSRRFSGCHVILNPVRVQGAEAAAEIAQAIDECCKHKVADLLIVARGGGSIEDLWPFNEMVVAEAIRRSSIPIISAVGHETDFTICDFVADLRAPTPSAAAEMATLEKREQLLHLGKGKTRLLESLRNHLKQSQHKLAIIARQPIFQSPYLVLAPYMQKIDEMKGEQAGAIKWVIRQSKIRLDSLKKQKASLNPKSRVTGLKRRFERKGEELKSAGHILLSKRAERLKGLTEHLYSLDPKNLLRKGYSIVFREKNDSVILSKDGVGPGERLKIQLSDGILSAEVIDGKSTPNL